MYLKNKEILITYLIILVVISRKIKEEDRDKNLYNLLLIYHRYTNNIIKITVLVLKIRLKFSKFQKINNQNLKYQEISQ